MIQPYIYMYDSIVENPCPVLHKLTDCDDFSTINNLSIKLIVRYL